MAQYCPECGIALADEVRICTNCGASTLEQVLISREIVEPTRTVVRRGDDLPGVVEPTKPAPFYLDGEVAPSIRGSSSQASTETEAAPPPTGKPGSSGVPGSVGRPELRLDLEPARKPTLKDFVSSLRLIADRQKLMWQAGGNLTAWFLFAVFNLLAVVTVDQSQVLALILRVMGWGLFVVMLLVTAALVAAAVTAEIGSEFQLEAKASSAILSRLPAILGPSALFFGLAAVGVGLNALLSVVARRGETGQIIWAALALPQFFSALSTLFFLLLTCASFVFVPTLAVTNGARLTQTLFRFFLIFRRDFKRAAGYFLLAAAFSLMVGVVVWGVSLLLLRSVELVAAEASEGRTTAIIASGNGLAVRLLPGGFPGLVNDASGAAGVVPQLQNGVRVGGFLWALSLVIISAVAATLPVLSLNVTGAAATSILLARLAKERITGKKAAS
jgi:hypothetical protein